MLPIVLALFAAGQLPAERSVWQLVVNQVDRGDIIIVIDGMDVWLPGPALEEAGLRPLDGAQREMFGERHVLLNSLAPMVRFELDTTSIRLLVTASPDLFSSRTYSVLPDRPPGLEYRRSFSGLINYAAFWETGIQRPALATELAVSASGGVFLSGFLLQPDGRLARGLSSIVVDQPSSRRRWTFGDTFGSPTELGSLPLVLGASVVTEYSLDPYYHRLARPVIEGAATLPSRADVYVDGQLVRELTLPPGPFRVDRLPVTTGLGNVDVIVRDSFGQQLNYGSVFYLAQRALRRGGQQYGYVAGLRREDSGDGAITYRHLVASGVHRFGVTDSLTLGAQAEGGDQVAVAGPIVNVKLWRAGELGWTGLFSAAQSKTGQAGVLSYLFSARGYSAYAVATYYSNSFTSLDRPGGLPADRFGRFEVAVPLGQRASLTFGGFWDPQQFLGAFQPLEPSYAAGLVSTPVFTRFSTTSFKRAAETSDLLTRTRGLQLRASVQLHRQVNLWGTVRRVQDEDSGNKSWVGLLRLDVALPGRLFAAVEGNSASGTNRLRAALDRSLPIGPGYGFRVVTDSTGNEAFASFDGQNGFGSASLRFRHLNGEDSMEATVAGSIAMIGERVLVSRPLNASFALVQVPGSKGVGVSLNNQPVGRTNRWGDLIVPDLIPYVDNRLRISDQDLPLDYAIANTVEQFAPSYRGGAVIRFPVAPIRTFTGRILLTDRDSTLVPEYGTLTIVVEDRTVDSPLSKEGDFYLENVPPGRYRATAISGQGRCDFEIDVPQASAVATSLGEIRCQRSDP